MNRRTFVASALTAVGLGPKIAKAVTVQEPTFYGYLLDPAEVKSNIPLPYTYQRPPDILCDRKTALDINEMMKKFYKLKRDRENSQTI